MKTNTANLNVKLLAANGKLVRHNGITFRVISTRLGNHILADAYPFTGQGERINLVTTRSKVGFALRNLINLGVVR